jgi:hypothetical protein
MSRARWLSSEVSRERDRAIDPIQRPFLGFAVRAIGGVDLRVSEPHPYLVERERLALSIEAQCHRGPRAERGEQEIVRFGSAVEPAGLDWLVGKEEMCQS